MTAPLAFLDTETDGLGPDRQIWDIAIIRRDPDGTETQWQAYLELDLRNSNLGALKIGHFYDRHPDGLALSGRSSEDLMPARTAKLVAGEIAAMTHGATIVGAVPNFDTEAIEKLLRGQGILPAWHHRLRCVETLAAGYLRREIGGLEACAAALGIPPLDDEQRHTALGDTIWTRDIYDAVMTGKALAA